VHDFDGGGEFAPITASPARAIRLEQKDRAKAFTLTKQRIPDCFGCHGFELTSQPFAHAVESLLHRRPIIGKYARAGFDDRRSALESHSSVGVSCQLDSP
jgi:hypothetical protein